MGKIIFEDRTQSDNNSKNLDGLCSAISVYATALAGKYKLNTKEYILILTQASMEMSKYFIKLNVVNEEDIENINKKADENSDKFIKFVEDKGIIDEMKTIYNKAKNEKI